MSRETHVDELIVWYALGALATDERAQVEQHLATCTQCRATLAEAQGVANMLSQSIKPITPSRRVKRNLMARVDADLAAVRPRTSMAVRAREWWASWGRGWAPAVAFASLILVLAFGWWNFTLQDELSRTRKVLSEVTNPSTLVATLPPAVNAPHDAQAKLFVAADYTSALLAVGGLKPLGPDQTYEFWLIRGGQSVPAGCFNVDQHGNGRLQVQSVESVGNFDQAGITIERGCALSPTLSALVFVGSIK